MTENYVTDDKTSVLVMVEYGQLKGWLKVVECHNPNCDEKYHYEFDESKQNQRIAEAIADGYLKLHIELNEWYYHPTDAGLELLNCLHCKKQLFTEKQLMQKGGKTLD